MSHPHTNSLIYETSPYLLQHAHNPVNWQAWSKVAFEIAKKEDKPVLISIGYSACHWCHVMEHESFEDEQTAEIMNNLYINIKVDREERPDVDQVYMSAVQLMTGHGGWPLNCIALPDGRPIYGGTYFPKNEWLNILVHIADLWKNNRVKILDYAAQLAEGIQQTELIPINKERTSFSFNTLHQTANNWKLHFDVTEGGPNRAPKFPMPNNYQFLLRYAHAITGFQEDSAITLKNYIHLTLKKIAFGGIYDQIGGGFARYATDRLWKIPHFEKMLYDNAQLVSLYTEAYQITKDELYKNIVYETIEFAKREFTSPEGAFYSALDADSEGEEGKYYVWTKEELKKLLKEKYDLAAAYFNVNELGYWEHDSYILMRDNADDELAQKFKISIAELQAQIKRIKQNLLEEREKRIRPGLDDKSLTSWNALMLKGLTDAYKIFGQNDFLEMALNNAQFIVGQQLKKNGSLFHSYKNGRSTINGFLEDYAFTIEAFIALYNSTFDEQWLETARKLTEYTTTHFYNSKTGMFYFTSDTDDALLVRKTEIHDNVTPASCSSIAKSLFVLGHYYGNTTYIEMSRQMLNNVIADMPQHGQAYSNWAMLLLYFTTPFYEVAIVGKNVEELRKAFDKHYLPNVIFAGSRTKSTIPLLENRFIEGKTLIYVCENNSCLAPIEHVENALPLIGINA